MTSRRNDYASMDPNVNEGSMADLDTPTGVEETSTAACGIHIAQLKPICPERRCLKTIVLLHGWMGTHLDMSLLGLAIAHEGYSVVMPDLPYHGKSVEVQPYSLLQTAKLLATALVTLLDSSPTQPHDIAIVGYSLGGRLALQLEGVLRLDHTIPLRLRAMILISSAVPPTTAAECKDRETRGKRISEALVKVPPTGEGLEAWLIETWYALPMWGGIQEHKEFAEMISRRKKGFDAMQREAWAKAATFMARYEPRKELPVCEIPSLYVHGQLDTKYTEMSTRMTELIRNCRVLSLEDSGHNVLLQSSRAATSSIIEFILKEYPVPGCKILVTLKEVKILHYSLPMKSPMIVGGTRIVSRLGFVIGIISDNGIIGIGDICPLPGLHTESVQFCVGEIYAFAKTLRNEKMTFCSECYALGHLKSITQGISKVSRNGVDCAITHILSKSGKMNLFSFLARISQNFFPVSKSMRRSPVCVGGVLPRMDIEKNAHAGTSMHLNVSQYLRKNHFPVLKLKVGSLKHVEEEAVQVRSCIKKVKEAGLKIRLDANKSWSSAQFEEFWMSLYDEMHDIEFIEEPFQRIEDMKAFLADNNNSRAPHIALDETLSNLSPEEVRTMASSAACKALVIKPSVLGSLNDIFSLIQISRLTRCTPILSAVFDSGVGLAWASLLAAISSDDKEICHGLGTFKHLSGDVHTPSFETLCVHGQGLYICTESCEKFLETIALQVLEEGAKVIP